MCNHQEVTGLVDGLNVDVRNQGGGERENFISKNTLLLQDSDKCNAADDNVSNKPAQMANTKHNWNKYRNSRADIEILQIA